MSGPARTILPIAGLLVLLGAISVVVTLLIATDEVADFPPGSPEDTVQRYIFALQDHDLDLAWEMLSTSAQDNTTKQDLGYATRSYPGEDERRRVRLDQVTIRDERATVTVTVERSYRSGLAFNRYSFQQSIRLVREDGEWKIDDPWINIGFDSLEVKAS